MPAIDYTWATGKRKTAIARVRIAKGNGKIIINGREPQDYLQRADLVRHIQKPLEACDARSEYDVFVNVSGGGVRGQAGAIRHGIARALDKSDNKNHSTLKKNGFLTRDPRVVERKKYGRKGARKRFQFSKR